MNVALQKPWAQTQDLRYEFDGLQPVAMTGRFNTALTKFGMTWLGQGLQGAKVFWFFFSKKNMLSSDFT